MKTSRPLVYFVVVLLALITAVVGCRPEEDPVEGDVGERDTEPGEPDAEEDVSEDPRFDYGAHDPYELVPFQPHVDSLNGHPDVEGEIPGFDEVRVGRIMEDTGFEGVWSHCRVGDFVLVNSVVRVCIQSETTNRYETFTGGKFVDARRHGQEGEDVLDMVKPLLDFGTVTGDNVEVVRDGTDGVAVLRVTGWDIDLAHLAGVLGRSLLPERSIEVVTEYRLEPGSAAVEMVTRFRGPATDNYTLAIGDWFAYGDRAQPWTPGRGLAAGGGARPWMGAIGDGYSFGLVFEDTATPLGVAGSQGIPWAELRIEQALITHSQPAVIRRWFMVGDGSIDSLRIMAAELRGEELEGQEVTVEIVDEGGQAVVGAEVLVYDDDGTEVTLGHSDEQGEVGFFLEAGEYLASVYGFAGPLMVERDLVVGSAETVTLEVPEVAQVLLSVNDADTGAALSSRVRFSHGELGTWSEYALKGELSTTLPVGEVTMVVTRGLEYDLHQSTVSVGAGDVMTLNAMLTRDVNTDGWRAGDFHQHMEPSIDSRVSVYRRVKENATQGVDLAVATDHEVVTDMQPAIDALGLSDELSTFPGIEISPLYAHYNLYPVPYRPDLRGRGSIELAYREDREVHIRRMPEIISMARNFETDPVVQMNHPRNNSGMLNHVEFDPELGPDEVTHPDFTVDIDTIEVINRLGDVCQVMADWAGLLNAGYRITGLGNSNTHGDNGEAGTPRNYMRMDRGPGEIDGEIVREVLRAGQVTVGTHGFIEFTDGRLPGDEVVVEGGTVSFNVRVTTPSWAQIDEVHVIVNGQVVETMGRTGAAGSNVDFEGTIEVEVEEDSWVVFWGGGPQPSAPIPVARPNIVFTNPVFLIAEGSTWEAPGVGPVDVSAIDTGYCN